MAVGAARFVKLLFFRKGNMVADNVVLQVEGLCFAYPECGVLNQWSVALPAGLALVRGDELITASGSIRHAVNAAKEIEQSARGLSAAMMWGNPFTDVPELASWAFVVTDNDPAMADPRMPQVEVGAPTPVLPRPATASAIESDAPPANSQEPSAPPPTPDAP